MNFSRDSLEFPNQHFRKIGPEWFIWYDRTDKQTTTTLYKQIMFFFLLFCLDSLFVRLGVPVDYW